MKITKIKSLTAIKIMKTSQYLLFMSFIYFINQNDKVISLLPMSVVMLLELFLPKEYSNGLGKNKKSIFFPNKGKSFEVLLNLIAIIIGTWLIFRLT